MTLLALTLVTLGQVSPPVQVPEFSGKILIAVRTSPQVAAEEGVPQTLSSPQGWTFRPFLTADPRAEAEPGVAAEVPEEPAEVRLWLVATPPAPVTLDVGEAPAPPPDNPWDLAYRIASGTAPAPYDDLLTAAAEATEGTVVEIEPDIAYVNQRLARRYQRLQSSVSPRRCVPNGAIPVLCDGPSFHWPPPDKVLAWHLGDTATQLKRAREAVYGTPPQSPPLSDRVVIAHLDTGYDPNRTLEPLGFDLDGCFDFTQGHVPVPRRAEDPGTGGFLQFPGHGTGTLAILAGRQVQMSNPAFDDFLGGAPFARVVSYRISGSVIHIFPSKMALAIETASTSGVDVISLSMGGLPSGALRDAVNNAYDRGTAIFAASGDFFKVPLLPLSTPHTTVYPARFERVVSVNGVTFKNRTYAKAPSLLTLLRGQWGSWTLRGSYGPASAVEGKALAAYAPNITRPRYSRAQATLLDLNFAGTSAATPQAAAAAALWLQRNRAALVAANAWRTWRKTEAVYQALFRSAQKDFPSRRHMRKYFGQGILKANDALAQPIPTGLVARPKTRIGFGWVHLALSLVTPSVTAEEALVDIHEQMMETEIAQLTATSRRLQRILREADPESLPPERQARFLRAVKREPRASEFLRMRIEEKGL